MSNNSVNEHEKGKKSECGWLTKKTTTTTKSECGWLTKKTTTTTKSECDWLTKTTTTTTTKSECDSAVFVFAFVL